jgi:CubicO group peptidase (beta-lactamase class C family)
LFGLAGAGAALVALPNAAAEAAPKDFRAYERLLADLAAQDKFSGTVLLAHRGKPVFTRSYGMANKESAIPNGKDTIFGLASVSKIFTAVAIAQLAQQGKLGFHEPLAAYLDGFPDKVTIHHLLTHTSGIGRPPFGNGGPPPVWQSFEQAMAESLAIIRSTPVQFTPPGLEHRYSNDGFWVLAGVVERVSGQSFFDYVRTRIFRAAGMTRTDFFSKPQVLANSTIARPYWAPPPGGPRTDFTASPYSPFTIGPPGGAHSTVSDLVEFVSSCGKVLSRPFADLITSGKVALPPVSTQTQFYGYGHIDAIVNNQRVYGHSGSGPGMATRLDVFPGLDWVSVVLGNYDTNIDPIVSAARGLITG